MSAQSAPTLTSLQGALKQPLEAAEWQTIVDFASRSWQVTPRTTLSPAQILALLNKVFVLRVARAQETLAIPQEEPVARRTWSAKPWQLALGAVCPAPCAVAPAVAQQPPAAFTAPFHAKRRGVSYSVFRPDNNLAAK
ncbi:flagella biosynthesis regulator [Klebsiella pneumoniae]|uniref:Flagella biosynthesis regulator n=1 Tax=Klebsiella pneumoniae TaxID=573 RepID=A0A2X1QBR9_KLEPN|nr:flagella biosynthesis regulator [Klebsiella pneumoniae]